MSTPSLRATARQALGLTAIGAGAIHLALGPEHMSQWNVLGGSFFASGAVQVLIGTALLRRESRRVLVLAALSSLAFIGIWAVSRTTGLPVGPSAFEREAVGTADLLCIALESIVALGAVALVLRPALGLSTARRITTRGVLALVLGGVLATTGVAIAAPSHGHIEHEECPVSAVESGVDANGNGADDGVEAYFSCLLTNSHDGPHKGGYVQQDFSN